MPGMSQTKVHRYTPVPMAGRHPTLQTGYRGSSRQWLGRVMGGWVAQGWGWVSLCFANSEFLCDTRAASGSQILLSPMCLKVLHWLL